MKLIAVLIFPVILIFLIAISSQQIALLYMEQYVQEYGLSREIYKIPVYISMLNSLHDKITEGHVILNNKNRPSIVNQMLLYQSKLTPELSKLAFKNTIFVNSWFQQNVTQIDQLDVQGQNSSYQFCKQLSQFKTRYLNHTSIFMNPPKISLAAVPPYLSQYTCQMANSKQYYVIDPRSLSIFFNSKKQYNYTNITQADDFYNIELQYLQDQDQAQQILKYIQDNYNKWVFSQKNNSYVNILQMIDLSQQVEVMDYIRNGTTYKAIFNPVIQYDQIPKIVTKYTQQQGLQLQYAYLQINIISDYELKTQTNMILSFFSNIFIGVQITLALISIIFLIITIILAFQIKKQITYPIIKMKETLEEINQLKEFVEISTIIKKYEERSDLILLSKETYLLYQSFLDLFEMIQYTSESFFIENEGKTLISLSKKADFFIKFKNYNAAGVTHNNIGNILLNQEHFFQALEHFSLAIMYAKYEISAYQDCNPDSYYNEFLYQYSYREYTNNIVGAQRQRQKLSISQNFIKSKIHFPRSYQFSTEKQQSYDYAHDQAQLGLNKKNISTSQKTSSPQGRLRKSRKISKETKTKIEDIFQQQNLGKTIQSLKKLKQQNYIATLIAFQEKQDSASNQQEGVKGFNFWKEINQIKTSGSRKFVKKFRIALQ
ncbi:transmembrane protein, putative (macronuclear) [Tetrahymena thermophila SB210]|uniref:Transmembrane protein, putative n=1 Tax=Tetrahymena thermophila (strain SB210) TaxID=312017 RepID=I7M615_TETTS|nr:transmembrane protein, putative [Tetrahymena thermophila SB210]EAR84023.3 transmembrane protein, putative [Tetrahymena thermophila SB210]|eukprot:XP_001031686.3 transmembrane protein, putative [Tetrahymena thermophila SB210]